MMAPKDVKHGGEYQRRLAKYAKTPIISQSIPPGSLKKFSVFLVDTLL